MDDKPYRSVLGLVMWGQLATRPDLSFSVSLLRQFQANPGIKHWNALMHVMGYIKNTIDYGLTYSRNAKLSPHTFVDANYGGCRDTCRSTSGYVFMVVGGPVTGSSKCQATVALSTVEAEYVAMSRCAQQMVWMHSWLNEVQVEYSVPGLLRGDNCGAIALMKNTKDHGKVKHIDICYHYIWELLQSRAITVEQVSSSDNLADMFTKPLLSEKRSGPVRFFCLFWVNRNRNRNRLPSLEIQKKPDRNCQKLPKTGPNQFKPVFRIFSYNWFVLTKSD